MDDAAALRERVKELTALHGVAAVLLSQELPFEERLRRVVAFLPPAMQHPEITAARLRLGGLTLGAETLGVDSSTLREAFATRDGREASLEVAYVIEGEAPDFLDEERSLLASVASMLRGAIDREHAEDELRRTHERFDLALEAAGMGVWEWEVRTNTARWSSHLARMLGAGEELAGPFGKNSHLVHEDDRGRVFLRLQAAARGEDDLRGLQFRFLRADGTYRDMLALGRVLGLPAPAERIVVALLDITDRLRLEAELRQAQKLEVLGHIAAGVAHDLNNLLSVISLNTDLARDTLSGGEDACECLDVIGQATSTGASVVNQLLTFSRRSQFSPASVDLPALIGRLMPILRRVAGKRVFVGLAAGDVGPVWADPTQLQQVVMNLVGNARDAMPEGGRVHVSVGLEHQGDEKWVTLRVEDEGVGVPADRLPLLFEPFFTTKGPGEGTGLGLAVVRNVVERWGGKVSVESELGAGTTFTVRLPAH